MNAVKLRYTLFASMAILIGLFGVGYYFLSHYLRDQVVATDHAQIDADLASQNTTYIQQLQSALNNNKLAVDKVQQIVGSQTDYAYQDQAIDQIYTIAGEYGISINGYAFPDTTGAGTTATPGAGATGKAALPSGVKQVLINVTFKSPITYDNYILFLRALELNLTRFQVDGIDITPDSSNPNQITNSSVGIEMFVRGK